jgi:hypothetical protein
MTTMKTPAGHVRYVAQVASIATPRAKRLIEFTCRALSSPTCEDIGAVANDKRKINLDEEKIVSFWTPDIVGQSSPVHHSSTSPCHIAEGYPRASQEGWDAAKDKGLIAESPYRPGTPEHGAWIVAWADGNALAYAYFEHAGRWPA